MALGTPVVSTTIGIEGIEARAGIHYLAGDTASEFADAVIRLLENSLERKRLSDEGRSLVENHYSWDHIGNRAMKGLEELCHKD